MAQQAQARPEWEWIGAYLQERLQDPVSLMHITAGDPHDPRAFASQEAAALARFLAQRVPALRVSFRSAPPGDDAPAFLVATNGAWRIRYLGVPLGSEAAPFLEALVLLSRREAPFPPTTLRLLRELAPVQLALYFTPT